MKFHRKWPVLVLLLAVVLGLSSCGGNLFDEIDDDYVLDAFCRTLVDQVIAGEKTETYAMFKDIATIHEFDETWAYLRATAEGATKADIHTTGMGVHFDNGVEYWKSQYFVQFDNGKDMNLSLTFKEGESIYGMHYMDITDFYPDAAKNARMLNTALSIYSLFVFAFSIWMIVDCARRHVRKKALWILLIIAGISLTFRVGEHNSFSFMVGLFLQRSNAWVDFGYLAVGTKIILPVGTVIYFFLRKRITMEPSPIVNPTPQEPFFRVPIDTEPLKEASTSDPAPQDVYTHAGTAAETAAGTAAETDTETNDQK